MVNAADVWVAGSQLVFVVQFPLNCEDDGVSLRPDTFRAAVGVHRLSLPLDEALQKAILDRQTLLVVQEPASGECVWNIVDYFKHAGDQKKTAKWGTCEEAVKALATWGVNENCLKQIRDKLAHPKPKEFCSATAPKTAK